MMVAQITITELTVMIIVFIGIPIIMSLKKRKH